MSTDPLSTIYRVPQRVLDTSHELLYACGLDGNEGTALWIGQPVADRNIVDITRLFIPEQIPIKTAVGVAVDLTERAHFTLTDHLAPGELFYCRIHSHPHDAYHSARDDANGVITHQGAISIVVPNFARDPLRLAHCAVYQLTHGKGWLPLSSAEVDRRFRVCS